jgi:hypothetical protein
MVCMALAVVAAAAVVAVAAAVAVVDDDEVGAAAVSIHVPEQLAVQLLFAEIALNGMPLHGPEMQSLVHSPP